VSCDYVLCTAAFPLKAKASVVKFEAEKGKPYKFCSDHYGIGASIDLCQGSKEAK